MGIRIPDRTERGGLSMVAINRIPKGYTVYPTGQGSDITNGSYQGGDNLHLTNANPERIFQFKDHWYAIGGISLWNGASLSDYVDAWLLAPATVGVNQAGDFTKFPTGVPGANIYVPTAPGAGDWDIDLTEKLNGNVDFTKASPVKNPDRTGFFDYEYITNTLTVNATQQGEYDLYDAQVAMFKFCNSCFGTPLVGGEMNITVDSVVGKVLLPHWKVKFKLIGGPTSEVAVILHTAVSKNVDNPFAAV